MTTYMHLTREELEARLAEAEQRWDKERWEHRNDITCGERRLMAVESRETALREALERSIEALDRAEPNRHSPWCNGVHEGSACEGDYLMSRFMDWLRAILAIGGKNP